MKSKSTWWLVALPLCAVGGFAAWGHSGGETSSDARSNILQPYRLTWDWTTEKWTGSDAPFAQIQSEVDAVETAKLLDAGYLKRMQQLADEAPQDAKAQFRWAYALLRAPYAGIQLRPGPYSDYESIVRAYERPASPHSYFYSRVRFLIMSLDYEQSQLKIVGKRLLQRNPNDTPVKCSLVPYLSYSRDPQERKLALKYAQELITRYPKWEGAYAIIARVYEQELFFRGDLAAADKGMAAWRTYISLLKGDKQNNREAASIVIQVLQKRRRANSNTVLRLRIRKLTSKADKLRATPIGACHQASDAQVFVQFVCGKPRSNDRINSKSRGAEMPVEMTMAEIENQFDSEWVLIEEPQTDESLRVLRGRVLHHSPNRDEVYQAAIRLHPKRSAILYTGKMPKNTAVVLCGLE